MNKLVALFAAVAVCALALSALSGAAVKTTTWTAALSTGQEIPKQVVKDANAHGLFKATLSGSTLKWKLTYASLTGPATAAHIHMGAKGKAGNVVVALCGAAPRADRRHLRNHQHVAPPAQRLPGGLYRLRIRCKRQNLSRRPL